MKYDFTAIEKEMADPLAEEKTFACQNGDTTKPKFYGLVEFPLPSAAGLHVGHPRPYTAMDVDRPEKADGRLQRAVPPSAMTPSACPLRTSPSRTTFTPPR